MVEMHFGWFEDVDVFDPTSGKVMSNDPADSHGYTIFTREVYRSITRRYAMYGSHATVSHLLMEMFQIHSSKQL